MTWTYASTDLSTDLAKVRRLIGDVSSSASHTLTDEEHNFIIGEAGNIYGAAAIECEALAAHFADQVSKTVGSLRLDASDKHAHFLALSDQFQTRAASGSVGTPQIYAGGLSVSDKDSIEADTDRVEPDFFRGQDDFPGTIANSSGV